MKRRRNMIPYDTKVLAFDLDGTLTQHKSPLSSEYKQLLTQLKTRYTLLMVGAAPAPVYFLRCAASQLKS